MKRMAEEADESSLWLALLRHSGLSAELEAQCTALESEFYRLTGFAVKSAKTAARGLNLDPR
jgi:hypothetical protein